jgi:raffinose/stachyose/melibiose transport system permease protein
VFVAINHPARPLSLGVFSLPQFTLDNIVNAWNSSNLERAILNTATITCFGLLIVVLAGASAAYVIARYPTRFNRFWFYVFLCCMMVPGIINTVPLYSMMRSIGGINKLWALILLLSCNRLPFCIFLFHAFVKSISRDMEEAAIIDGCSPFSAFWLITFPIMKPVTSTVIITSSVGFWNNYNQAVFFLQKRNVYTIPLAIASFYTEFSAQWNLVAAAALIGIIPIIIIFLSLQKYFIKGLAAGAVKG